MQENVPDEANCTENTNKAPQSVKKRIEVSEAVKETGTMLKYSGLTLAYPDSWGEVSFVKFFGDDKKQMNSNCS